MCRTTFTFDFENDRRDPVTILENNTSRLVRLLRRNAQEGEIMVYLSTYMNASFNDGWTYIDRFVFGKDVKFGKECDFREKVIELIRDLDTRLEEPSPLPKFRIQKTEFIKIHVTDLRPSRESCPEFF
jgi:hypothetical protein